MQPGHPSERWKLMDLDDAPELDSSDEAALDAIRRQLDEEFGRLEAAPEAADPAADQDRIVARPAPDERDRQRSLPLHTEPRPRPEPEPEPWTRPAPDSQKRTRADRAGRARPSRDAEVRARLGLGRDPRERPHSAWARPERFRDERTVQPPSRIVRESGQRLAAQRIPSRWREPESPATEPRSRRGLFVAIGLTAGLAGGAAGAVLTVLLLTGNGGDPLRASWGRIVAAARDSGLGDVAAAVKDRALSGDPWDRGRDETVRPPASPRRETATQAPSSTPRRGPVTTSEIPEPVQRGAAAATGSHELRDLVAAGRDAYVRRDYATAELLFARAVERSLSDGLLRYHHAIALMGLGRFAEARTEFGHALRLGVDPVVADEARQALAQLDTGRRRR